MPTIDGINNKTKSNNLHINLTDHNKFMEEIVDAKIKQEKLATKDDVFDCVTESYFDNELKALNKKVPLNKIKYMLIQNKFFKNCKHLTQDFLTVKVTLLMMDDLITWYFNKFTKLLQRLLFFHTQSQNGNLKRYQM